MAAAVTARPHGGSAGRRLLAGLASPPSLPFPSLRFFPFPFLPFPQHPAAARCRAAQVELGNKGRAAGRAPAGGLGADTKHKDFSPFYNIISPFIPPRSALSPFIPPLSTSSHFIPPPSPLSPSIPPHFTPPHPISSHFIPHNPHFIPPHPILSPFLPSHLPGVTQPGGVCGSCHLPSPHLCFGG